ncbi:MAG: nuclear transport factor 2 family protein [Bacteroidetes bacterium]|nr:nuclear transport factor 2 family protein [Bacteroidota bacterium]
MKRIIVFVAGCCLLIACNNKPAATTTESTDSTASAAKPTPPVEFSDTKYSDIGKKNLEQLSSGDIDGWVSSFTDNAVYRWSSGDSLAGKAAIASYWKDRRTKVIDSISFMNDIWLPIKVNKPQKGPDAPGNWLLSWYMVNVKYKNGKKLMFWVHTDMHFDNNDKIDVLIQYLDRAPINKALGMK